MINGTQITKRILNSEAHRRRAAMMLAPGRDYAPRRVCRDDVTPMWPERCLGRDPAINLAEVERALSHPRRRAPAPPAPQTAKADRRRTPGYSGPPADIGEPPMMPNGKRMTFTEAGRMLGGIAAAAAFKKIHRYGWHRAMTMSRAQSQ
jgi:hypothetical protein